MSEKPFYNMEVATLIVVAFVVMSSVLAMLIIKNNPPKSNPEHLTEALLRPVQECDYACCDQTVTNIPFDYTCPNRRHVD